MKDLTAHLLHGSLRRVSRLRDHYRGQVAPIAGFDDLVAFIQQNNREFMTGMRLISPGILIDLIGKYDPLLVELFESLDPDAAGLGVGWAGDESSPNWFDIAREYTEKWHHQQQLRMATDRALLDEPSLLQPVLETFARGFPHAYRGYEAEPGAFIRIEITGPVELAWTLLSETESWRLYKDAAVDPVATVSLPCDVAWRLWTKSIDPARARTRARVQGDESAAEPLFDFVAIMK